MKNKKRRCDDKVPTMEAKILKYMRESRNLSMRQAAKKVGVSSSTINHIDNGRKDLNEYWIYKLVTAYGYSYIEFTWFEIFSSK